MAKAETIFTPRRAYGNSVLIVCKGVTHPFFVFQQIFSFYPLFTLAPPPQQHIYQPHPVHQPPLNHPIEDIYFQQLPRFNLILIKT